MARITFGDLARETDAATYTENGAGVAVDVGGNVTVSGPIPADGGMAISVASQLGGARAGDALFFAPDGGLAFGAPPVDGSLQDISIGGRIVAWWSPPSRDINSITLMFNGNTTTADVETIIRAVRFRTDGDDPSTDVRDVSYRIYGSSVNDVYGIGVSTVAVTAVDDAPTAGGLTQILTVDRNGAGTFLFTSAVTVGDVDSAQVTVVFAVNAAHGTLAGTGLSGPVDGRYTLTVATADAAAAIGSVTFTPATGYAGSAPVTVTVTDNANGLPDAADPMGTVTVTVGRPDAAPTATLLDQSETYNEDTPMSLADIVVTDTDSATVTVTLTLSDPGAGTLSTNTSGAVTSTYVASTGVWTASGATANVNTLLAGVSFHPASNSSRSFTIATSVSDGTTTITGSKAVTGIAVNDAPTTSGGSLTQSREMLEDGDAIALFGTLPVISDQDSAVVTATLTLSPGQGTLIGAGTAASGGVYTLSGSPVELTAALAGVKFAPAADFAGSANVAVVIGDGPDNGTQGSFPTGTVTIAVTGIDDLPRVGGGSLTQTRAMDEDGGAIAVFSPAPVVSDPDSAQLQVNFQVTSGNGAFRMGGEPIVPVNGRFSFGGSAAQVNAMLASLTFTPAPDFFGTVSLTATVTDNFPGTRAAGDLPTGTVTINVGAVNDAPPVANDTVNLPANSGTTVINVLANDGVNNVDGAEPLRVTAVTQPSTGGSVELVNGEVRFTPIAGFGGQSSFTYTVSDRADPSARSSTATVTVNVAANAAPTATGLGTDQTYVEDTRLILDRIVITDDSPSVTATLTLSDPAAGTLLVPSSGDLTTHTFANGVLTVGGTPSAVNLALSGVRFDPKLDYNADIVLTTVVRDSAGLETTGAKRLVGTPVNDAPKATNLTSTLTVDEDATATLFTRPVRVTDVDGPGETITATLTLSGATGTLTGAGTASGNVYTITGSAAQVTTALAGVRFAPGENVNGTAFVDVTISDGGTQGSPSGRVTVNITAVNDAPTATNLTSTLAMDEDAAATLLFTAPVTVADVDLPGQTITATLTLGGAAGTLTGAGTAAGNVYTITGTAAQVTTALAGVRFAPATNVNGTATVDVTISDGGTQGSPAGRVTVNIAAVNDAPTATNLTSTLAVDEDAAATLLFTTPVTVADVDLPGQTITATLTLGGAAGTLTGAGTVAGNVYTITGTAAQVTTALAGVRFAPATNVNGTATVDVTISDGGTQGSPSGRVTVNITAVNDAPTVSGGSLTQTRAMQEDGPAVDLFDANPMFVDAEGDTITVRLTLNTAQGSLTGAGTAVDGVYTVSGTAAGVATTLAAVQFAPARNFNGEARVSVAVTDGKTGPQGTNPSGTVTINVAPVNDAPTATNLTQSLTVAEDAAATALFTSPVVVADIDGVGEIITVTLTLNPAQGALTGAGERMFGMEDPILLARVFNGAALAAPSAPVADTYRISGTASQVTAKLALVGFVPAANFNGTASVGVSVSDAAGLPTGFPFLPFLFNPTQGTNPSGTVTVTVTPVDDAPTATGLSTAQTYIEDLRLDIATIVVADADGPGVPLTVTLMLSNAQAGVLTTGTTGGVSSTFAGGTWTARGTAAEVNALLGQVAFVPARDFNGEFTIATRVEDATGLVATGTKRISSVSVNDAPVVRDDVASVRADGSVLVRVLDNDFDVDSIDVVNLSAVSGSGSAVVEGNAIRFTPGAEFASLAAGQTRTVDVGYTVADDKGATGTATARITVTGVNDAPVAVNDAASVARGTSVAIDVLANDRDVDAGDVLTLTGASVAAGRGSVSVVDGRLVYDAGSAFDWLGAGDRTVVPVTYTVRDAAGATATGTASVTVTGTTSLPTPPAPSYTLILPEGGAATVRDGAVVVGSAGLQEVTVADAPGRITFDGSFNAGGDRIRLDGPASGYTIVRSGSSVIVSDGDTTIVVPVGVGSLDLVFGDGVRSLTFSTAAGVTIGGQAVTLSASAITAAAGTPTVTGVVDPNAQSIAATGAVTALTVSGNTLVAGTERADTVTVLPGATAVFDGSFAAGGDTIVLSGAATSFTAMRSGSSLVLESGTGSAVIPIGVAGTTIRFADGDRVLLFDPQANAVTLGGRIVGTAPAPLPASASASADGGDLLQAFVTDDASDAGHAALAPADAMDATTWVL